MRSVHGSVAVVLVVCVATGGACLHRGAPTDVPGESSAPAPAPERPAPPAPKASVEPEPPPPEPRPLPDERSPDVAETREALEGARTLLVQLEDRPLDEEGETTRATAADFLDQAERAISTGDVTRARVLIEKARVLLVHLREGGR